MKNIGELNQLYNEAEAADSEVFSEQRSNLLLVSGNHYSKQSSKFWSRVRESEGINREQKIRLTKNHIQKITKTYVNNILSFAPGVGFGPKNQGEIQDQKAAELCHSVWTDLKTRERFNAKRREFARDFIEIGECVAKVFYDENAGDFVGFEAEIDPETGEVVGQGKPRFAGKVTIERYHGFNTLRHPDATSFEDSPVVILRKMVPVSKLLLGIPEGDERRKFVQESSDSTYKVFDAMSGSFSNSKGKALVKEYYFRKCDEYPNGYYYITTDGGILFEGELPFGIFPVVFAGFDEFATTPRGYSIIKALRPFQAEINRTASKIAEHQVTLGDDKVMIAAGTTLSPGATAHGVKSIQVSGPPPTILSGRNGEQFVGYMQAQIEEMYVVANVLEDSEEKIGQLDPHTLLYRSLRDKKRFSIYTEKFEEFLVDIALTAVKLAKQYYDVERVIPIVGRAERVNIAEFKSLSDLSYQVKMEPQTDDAETKLGQQLSLNHILQYVGGQLEREDIGALVRAMPYANKEQVVGDMLLDYDNACNDILALDRGEVVAVRRNDKHEYLLRRLTARMKASDFRFLHPRIQQNYNDKVAEHENALAVQQQEEMAAKSGWIPSGGYLVTMDFYLPNSDPGKAPKRARLPYESVVWLINRLEAQGSTQAALEGLDTSNLNSIQQQANMSFEQMPPEQAMIDPEMMAQLGASLPQMV